MVYAIIKGILSLALFVISVILLVDKVRETRKRKKLERQREKKEFEEMLKRIGMAADGNITVSEAWEFAERVGAFAAARYPEDCKQIGERRALKKYKELTNRAYRLALDLIKEQTKDGNNKGNTD